MSKHKKVIIKPVCAFSAKLEEGNAFNKNIIYVDIFCFFTLFTHFSGLICQILSFSDLCSLQWKLEVGALDTWLRCIRIL